MSVRRLANASQNANLCHPNHTFEGVSRPCQRTEEAKSMYNPDTFSRKTVNAIPQPEALSQYRALANLAVVFSRKRCWK